MTVCVWFRRDSRSLRATLWSDLNQIEIGLLGQLECLVGRHDANGFTVGSDEPDLGYPDPVVDAQLGADESSSDSTDGMTEIKKGFRLSPNGSQSRHISPTAGHPCHWDLNPTTFYCNAVDAGGSRIELDPAWLDQQCRHS